MSTDHTSESKEDANQFREVLNNLDVVLKSELLDEVSADDIKKLRADVKQMLINMETYVEGWRLVDEKDFFGNEPSLALNRLQFIKNIKATKINFEFEILPKIRQIAEETVEKVKQNPPETVDVKRLPPPPSGESWTTQKVLDTAEKFLTQATTAGGVVSKAYKVAQAIALVAGVPLPPLPV